MKTIITGALQATDADIAALEALGLEVTVHPMSVNPYYVRWTK